MKKILNRINNVHIFYIHYEDVYKNIYRKESFDFDVLNTNPIKGFAPMLDSTSPCFQAINFKIDGRKIVADIEIYDNYNGQYLNIMIKEFNLVFRPAGCINRVNNSKEVVYFAINKILAKTKQKDTLIEPKKYTNYDN